MENNTKQDILTVKPGLENEWEEAVANNQDPYGHRVVEATIAVGNALDKGVACDEAEKACHGLGVTGFMAGCMAQWIMYFHPRGEEFQSHWNKALGGTGEEKGVINPAILIIGDQK